tara:strand:- start:1764 stop:2648 length:885 start_codon:yes stop_codon:yes gene_type:complete
MINISFPITKTFESKKSSMSKQIIFNQAIDDNQKLVSDLNLDGGHVYTLYGNNGIGKTTFMNILSLLTNSNQLSYNKEDQFYYGVNSEKQYNVDKKSDSRKKYFSFIFQDPHIINMYTLRENMEIVNSDFNYNDDFELIKNKILELDLRDKTRDFLMLKINKFIKDKNNTPFYLSGGEKQLLAFIRALIKPSNILFADEPWASMDLHLKEFIEMQLYRFIHDDDIFSFIRNRNCDLNSKKVVMIISHPTQKRENEVIYGEKEEGWTKQIPVTDSINAEITSSTQRLYLERYNAV